MFISGKHSFFNVPVPHGYPDKESHLVESHGGAISFSWAITIFSGNIN